LTHHELQPFGICGLPSRNEAKRNFGKCVPKEDLENEGE
jgi:hypothetical protein